VRSLQFKFSILVVGLLVLGSVALTMLATRHERLALETEIERFGVALARNLAGDAKIALLENDQLALDTLVETTGEEKGVVAARLLDRSGLVVGSLDDGERGLQRVALTAGGAPVRSERREPRLLIAVAVIYSKVHVGEAQVELDLRRLIEPVVRETRIQLGAVAVAVVGLGVACGVGFVALLIGPIRRLRAGVERLTAGDLAARVPPTSSDEVGELTRAFNEMGESLQQKERIQRAFGRYASDYVLNALLETPEGTEVEGAEREVTLMFVDVRGFTRMSEGLKARDVVSLLNDVFQLVSDAILQRGGTLDKFIGDSVMAYFGAPIPSEDHAVQAVNTAVDIMRAIRNRNRSLTPGDHAAELGIGIHTGPVVVGNIGSDRRTDFTAIGDAVNVAARLEKLAKPGEILVTEAVLRRVRGAHRLRFEGERQLSGRVEPVHVYAVEVPEQTPASAPAGRTA
jgi:class 3 adenylate cyclase